MSLDTGDAVTIALIAVGMLVVVGLLALPAILRAVRIRRFERMLGTAHWPFLVALEQRDSIHQEPRDARSGADPYASR